LSDIQSLGVIQALQSAALVVVALALIYVILLLRTEIRSAANTMGRALGEQNAMKRDQNEMRLRLARIEQRLGLRDYPPGESGPGSSS
jgi:Sec-independent protein translocase protein TatA